MKIRSAMALTSEQLADIHVDGVGVQSITYHPGNAKPYRVQTGSGLILECRENQSASDDQSAPSG